MHSISWAVVLAASRVGHNVGQVAFVHYFFLGGGVTANKGRLLTNPPTPNPLCYHRPMEAFLLANESFARLELQTVAE